LLLVLNYVEGEPFGSLFCASLYTLSDSVLSAAVYVFPTFAMNFHLQGQQTNTKIACTLMCQNLVRTTLLADHSHTYKRHRPEQTLLYQLVERHYPEFLEQLSHQGKSLPKHVEKEFEEFLR
jgi:hypothetical protein